MLEELTPEEPPPDDPPRNLAALFVSVVLIAVLVLSLHAYDDELGRRRVFPEDTGQLLVFEDTNGQTDDYGAIAIVDLDHRVLARRLLKGNVGTNPHFLLPLGDGIAYGTDHIYATPLWAGEERQVATRSTVSPAAKPGHVLVTDASGNISEYASPHRVVARRSGRSGDLGIGAGNGVAYKTKDGIAVWDWNARRDVRRLGSGEAYVVSAVRDVLVWCDQLCSDLHVSDVRGRSVLVHARRGLVFGFGDPPPARVSPDGRYVAAIAGIANGGSVIGRDVVLIDARSGRRRTVYGRSGSIRQIVSSPTWSSDGRRLFFVIYDQNTGGIEVGQYVISSGEVYVAPLPVDGAFAPIAVRGSLEDLSIEPRCTRAQLTVAQRRCSAKF